MIKNLSHLKIIFGEDHFGLGVVKDVADILMLGRRVDRRCRGRCAHDGKVSQDPLHPGIRRDGHPVLTLDAKCKQASR